MTGTEKARLRRAKMKQMGLSARGRPLGKPRRKWAVSEKETKALVRLAGLTHAGVAETKREASEHLIQRTSNWRITDIK